MMVFVHFLNPKNFDVFWMIFATPKRDHMASHGHRNGDHKIYQWPSIPCWNHMTATFPPITSTSHRICRRISSFCGIADVVFIFYALWFLWKINSFIFRENLQKNHQFYPQIADAVRKNVSQKPTNSGIQNWHRSPWVGGNPAKKCSPHLQVHGWYKSIIPEWAALPYSVHHSKPLGLLPPVLILSHSHPLKKSPTFRASMLTSHWNAAFKIRKKNQSDVSWNFPRPSVLT